METILRSKEMAEIKLLPVRHHSPACAFHVKRVMEEWKPEAVLIEGPDNANVWISVMVHEDTKAPFALYYSYDDTTGKISDEKEKYKCYYPFLDYSPELAALRTGAKQGIYTAFIDMPYGDILVACEEGKGLLKEAEKNNYNDDYLLSRSAYIQTLCEKTGVRSFDEFWEKYFELEGLYQDSETWFANLLMHCTLSRASSVEAQLQAEGCLQREVYMAERILEVAGKGLSKILVVTGGFHTPELVKLLEQGNEAEKKKNKRKGVPAKDQAVYLMPYSMEATDALNGYASGMPYSGFYQSVWEQLVETEDTPYEKVVLDYIIHCGRKVRSKEGGVSTYDEICACSMAKGLAALRGKKEPGAYELQDTVLSNFVKGEYTIATDLPMRQLQRLMTGRQIGALCKDANEPPILQDFRERCKSLKLNIASTTGVEVTLSIFSKKKHRQVSVFFHRLDFLKTNFANRTKGPNLQTGRDRNLMREIWKYKWSVQVMAALIDASVYGATVEEAVLGMVKQEVKRELSAKESALLLTKVFEMGLDSQLDSVYARVYELLLKDTDFYSLAACLRTLCMLQELCSLYQSELELQKMIQICCRKLIGLLSAMTRVKEEDMSSAMEAIKTLYQVTGRRSMAKCGELRESYLDALQTMKADRDIQAGVHGCVHGILYGCGREAVIEIEQICKGYLAGTKEQFMQAALFFRGLFFAAKDLVFVGPQFMQMLDDFLKQVSEPEFLKLLPELRMAFTYFTPAEVNRIAEAAARLHGKKKADILEKKGIPGSYYIYGRDLDAYVRKRLGEK